MSFDVPKQLLDGVVRVFDPVEVYLFGSHARGDANEDSDIDLFVIVDDERSEDFERGAATAAARNGYRGPLDLLVTTRSSHARRKSVIGTLNEIVAGEGRLIYERA